MSIVVGKIFYSLSSSSSGAFYESVEQAKLSININQLSGYTVLLKGSRGVALERLIM